MNDTEAYMYEGMVASRDRLSAENERLLALLERVRNEMEASGGWDGDEELFAAVCAALK